MNNLLFSRFVKLEKASSLVKSLRNTLWSSVAMLKHVEPSKLTQHNATSWETCCGLYDFQRFSIASVEIVAGAPHEVAGTRTGYGRAADAGKLMLRESSGSTRHRSRRL